jgi:hypothetical protein
MAQFINNNRVIYNLEEAIKKVRDLPQTIIEYAAFCRVIQYELYYVLKHISRANNGALNRDILLCELIDKCDGFYIKTPEVKRILSFLKTSREPVLNYTWFMKNIDKGYKPTTAIINDVLDHLTMENIDKIIELNGNNFNKTKIFCQHFLINDVFNNNVQTAHQIFKKYSISDGDINTIITTQSFIPSTELANFIRSYPEKFNTYLTNIINYKKEYKLKFTYEEFIILFDYALENFIKTLYIENIEKDDKIIAKPSAKQTIANLKEISIKLTDDQLIALLDKCFHKLNDVMHLYLNFIKLCINFDKIDISNIHKLIAKLPFFSKFPGDIFETFYKTNLDLSFITSLIINKHSQFILDILKTPETQKILCTNDEIFKVAVEYAAIPLIKYFLNNKYSITEEMVLNNNSDGLFTILNEAVLHGFYVTDKCFDHLVFILYLNGCAFDYKKIQQVSIYVNDDDDDFKKFIPMLEATYNNYKNLELNILTKQTSTLEYIKDKKVTNEMIILCNNKIIRNILFDRMNKEKQVKKVIVKKVVKKSNL